MTLPFPKAFRRLTLTPISHQTCCFLWLQETFLLFQQGQPPSFLWKCFTYCQPSLSAAQPATLAFLFSNIIFFPEFLSNPNFSQGRTALSKIKKKYKFDFHFQSFLNAHPQQSSFIFNPDIAIFSPNLYSSITHSLSIRTIHKLSQSICSYPNPSRPIPTQPIPTYPNPTQPDLSHPNQPIQPNQLT